MKEQKKISDFRDQVRKIQNEPQTYEVLAMMFSKGKTINLDLLAKFQSLCLTPYLSSSASFSYHDLHPLSSLQLPCGIFLLTSAQVADYPARVLLQQLSVAFCKNTLVLKDVRDILNIC